MLFKATHYLHSLTDRLGPAQYLSFILLLFSYSFLLFFFSPYILGTANADELFRDCQNLDASGVLIPKCITYATIDLLAKRRDAYRIELLVHLATRNIKVNSYHESSFSASTSTNDASLRSLSMGDPINELVSFSVSGLMKHGCTDEALMLWVRMANTGRCRRSS